ncbi:FAD-containing oxidoreductase [Rhizobium sp. GN54]|uniref:FAD-containing oxidoreductase n=1 Tax=Rhizobium sp. GN54 TaxID=2898150 RepID=UPI001E56B683|nr:FAD-containing oxidoreductase [Rhizobium sp. GN54]MCD2184456.1 FAD-containing oxidoreductase [Rhizobium sp. GN54]
MRKFDAIVVGAGQAGPSLAARIAEGGRTVAIVERKFLGGTCVNAGCMPTKTLVASARAAHVGRRAADFGVRVSGDVTVDMKVVSRRAQRITLDARNGLEDWLGKMERVTIVRGHARFEASDRLSVDGEPMIAPWIFLNVGARPAIPDMEGLDGIDFLTSTSILSLDTLPRHLAIVGGSYIALEFAQMYRRFGAEVTVIERGARIAPREDEDVSRAIREILEAEGIHVLTGAEHPAFARSRSGTRITVGETEIDASHVLLATGRRPNTDDLGLEAAGIVVDRKGYVTVDDKLATSVPGIWALGDCNGHGAFTHTSYNDFEIVAANLLDGEDRKVSSRIPAYALYIDPPLGRVGMTEQEALASGRKVLVSKRAMSQVGRAKERDETKGFMKVVADPQSGKILGAAILGIEGDEAIHGIVNAMNAGTGYRDLEWSVPIHPTVSELIPTLLRGLA